jgi:hypothetical protein
MLEREVEPMRTTLNLDPDMVRAARALAESEGRSLGEVVSDLMRRGLRPDRGIGEERGFPVFDVPAGTPPLTPELVQRALEED